MRRFVNIVLAILLLFTLIAPEFCIYAASENVEDYVCQATLDDDFADDCVLVAIDKTNSEINKVFSKDDFNGVEIASVEDLTHYDSDPTNNRLFNEDGFYQILKLNLANTGKDEVLKAIKVLEELEFIVSAEPNYRIEIDTLAISSASNNFTSVYSIDSLTSETVSCGTAWIFDYINVTKALEVINGNYNASIKVGVIDSEFHCSDELTGKIDFELAKDMYSDECGKEAIDEETSGHGTTMCQCIAAHSGEVLGIAGTCNNIKVVPMKVYNPETDNGIDAHLILKAVNYASEKDIPIINCSFGYSYKTGLWDAAMEKYEGLIVCSAGNRIINTDNAVHEPSTFDFDNIISVAGSKYKSVDLATQEDWGFDENGNPRGSNYGIETVDIVAPGTFYNSDYTIRYGGTSMSAAFVSGVAALILSVHPELNGVQLREIIIDSAQKVPELADKIGNGGAFLDAGAAVDAATKLVDITFDVNGGTLNGANKVYVTSGDSYTVNYIPVKEGSKFLGWKYGDKVYKYGETITNVTADVTLVSQWEEVFRVLTYDAKYNPPKQYQEVYYSDTVTVDGKLVIPCSELSSYFNGYYLRGWKIEGGDDTVYEPGSSGNLPGFENYTLIDVADERAIGTLTYDANGGENAPAQQSVYYRSGMIITNNEPTRDGYTFLGWAKQADEDISYAPGSYYYASTQTTLYAKWINDGFVIRFSTGVSDSDDVPAQNPPLSVVYDTESDSITLPTDAPTREGYFFRGWNYNGTTYESGDTFSVPESVLSNYSTDGNNVIVLSAVWEKYPATQLIAFVDSTQYGGKTNTAYTRMVTVGETYGSAYSPDDETQTAAFPVLDDLNDYYFDGWADSDGNIVNENTSVTKEGFHMIYARWIPKAAFTDITTLSASSVESISLCNRYGYLLGTDASAYSPASLITAGATAAVLYRFEGSPVCGNNIYYDINTYTSDGDYSEMGQAVSWATELAIIEGESNYYFNISRTLSKEDILNTMFLYSKSKGLLFGKTYPNSLLDSFTDAEQLQNSSVKAAIKWAIGESIVPVSGTFGAENTVTREEFAVIIANLRSYMIENGEITTLKGGAVNIEADSVGYIYPELNNNSWETVSAVSAAGIAEAVWNVGDEKTVTLSTGETVTVQIYGFNHDDLSDGGGKAGITFGLKEVMQNTRRMHNAAFDGMTFTDTDMYSWLNGELYSSLPAELRTLVANVDKKTAIGDGGTQISTDSMKIFLFSEVECFGGTAYSVEGEGSQYAIFAQDATERSKVRGDILEWWERSPKASGSSSFCIVHSSGNAGHTASSWPYAGVNFGFCV